ncbi:Polycomb complex protein BMI-1 [Halotydeus destructor]|nr:Polycomb complex protein BMI-1 [Halotydeus destructor]
MKKQNMAKLGIVSSGGKVHCSALNEFISCFLCNGYLIDATTIIECLHSFCRTCIVNYLNTKINCPKCHIQVHETKPLLNIRPDPTLQDIVYKIIPGLYEDEMKRRKMFFAKNPEAAKTLNSGEEKGEICGERNIYSPDDYFSLSIEYLPQEINYTIMPLKANGGETQLTRSKSEVIETVTPNKDNYPKRYLRCQGAVRVFHFKKLIRNKYDLRYHHDVEMFYKHDPLSDEYSVLDLAYIYSWRRNEPLALYYKISDLRKCLKRKPQKESPVTAVKMIKSKQPTVTNGVPMIDGPVRNHSAKKTEVVAPREIPVHVDTPRPQPLKPFVNEREINGSSPARGKNPVTKPKAAPSPLTAKSVQPKPSPAIARQADPKTSPVYESVAKPKSRKAPVLDRGKSASKNAPMGTKNLPLKPPPPFPSAIQMSKPRTIAPAPPRPVLPRPPAACTVAAATTVTPIRTVATKLGGFSPARTSAPSLLTMTPIAAEDQTHVTSVTNPKAIAFPTPLMSPNNVTISKTSPTRSKLDSVVQKLYTKNPAICPNESANSPVTVQAKSVDSPANKMSHSHDSTSQAQANSSDNVKVTYDPSFPFGPYPMPPSVPKSPMQPPSTHPEEKKVAAASPVTAVVPPKLASLEVRPIVSTEKASADWIETNGTSGAEKQLNNLSTKTTDKGNGLCSQNKILDFIAQSKMLNTTTSPDK